MKHKLGIIGYGTMGSWHAENVRDRIADLEVIAVYDIDPQRLEKAKENGFIPETSIYVVYGICKNCNKTLN